MGPGKDKRRQFGGLRFATVLYGEYNFSQDPHNQ